MPDATAQPDATSETGPGMTAGTTPPPPPAAPWAAPGSWQPVGSPPPAPWHVGAPQPQGWAPPPPGWATAAYGAPPAEASRPRTIARVSLTFGVVGLFISWVPILTWFAAVLLVVAVILAIVALASPRQGGPGFAAGGLATGLFGLLVSLAMTVPSILLLGGEFAPMPYAPEPAYERAEAEPAMPLEVIEYATGRESAVAGSWWYGAVIDNPNLDWIYSSSIEVRALGADGTVLATVYEPSLLLQGTTAIAGSFDDLGDAVVDRIEVVIPGADDAELSYWDETASIYIEDVQGSEADGVAVVTGTVWGDIAEDARRVPLTAIAHGTDGRIIGAVTSELGLLPATGDSADFTITFPGSFPEGTTFEVYASF